MRHRLTIATFLFSQPRKWRQLGYAPYTPTHVNALWRACAANIKIPHRFIAYTDHAEGIKCERRPSFPRVRVSKPDGISTEDGCYSRLRLYDPKVQEELNTDFIVILDLDMVFLRDCTALFEECMAHDFTALRGSPYGDGLLCSYYNGSFQMCRTGARPQFWHGFDTKTFYQQRARYRILPGKHRPLGTDQAWLSMCAGPGEKTIWEKDGACQYRNFRNKMPDHMRMIFFAGREKPWAPSVRKRTPQIADAWARYAV